MKKETPTVKVGFSFVDPKSMTNVMGVRIRKEKLVYASEHHEEVSVFPLGQNFECFMNSKAMK